MATGEAGDEPLDRVPETRRAGPRAGNLTTRQVAPALIDGGADAIADPDARLISQRGERQVRRGEEVAPAKRALHETFGLDAAPLRQDELIGEH